MSNVESYGPGRPKMMGCGRYARRRVTGNNGMDAFRRVGGVGINGCVSGGAGNSMFQMDRLKNAFACFCRRYLTGAGRGR